MQTLACQQLLISLAWYYGIGLRSKRGEQGKHDEDEGSNGEAADGVSEDAHG